VSREGTTMINSVGAAIKLFFAASAVCMVSPAQADIITDWNAKAVAIMAAERVTVGVQPARTLAIMHIAMFDAANGSAGRYISAPSPSVCPAFHLPLVFFTASENVASVPSSGQKVASYVAEHYLRPVR
jgi:hypothetical protein